MLFLFESSWLPIVGLFVSSETPGPGCFPWEGAGGDGWRGGAGLHGPVQGSRYYFPRTSPAAVSHRHKPCPRYSDGRGRMRATLSPRHLEGKGDRRQSPRRRGEGGGSALSATHHSGSQWNSAHGT